MGKRTLRRQPRLWLWVAALVLIILLMTIVFTGSLDLGLFLGPLRANHWLSILGAGFIAMYTPFYYYWKRRRREWYGRLLGIHIAGNLFGFGLVSQHFAWQLQSVRPIVIGSGLPMYTALLTLVVTGSLQYFHLRTNRLRTWRFVHQSMALSFYLIIFFHIAHGARVA